MTYFHLGNDPTDELTAKAEAYDALRKRADLMGYPSVNDAIDAIPQDIEDDGFITVHGLTNR